ncbi:HAD hydrolase-like protein [Streptomyces sp. NPDC093595]
MIGDNSRTDIEGGRAAELRMPWIAAGSSGRRESTAPTRWR